MTPLRRILLGAVLTALIAHLAISTDLLAPALPAIAKDFGAGQGSVQLTMTIFVWGFALAQLIYGPLSDRFGRRPVLIAGVAIYVLASTVCYFATSPEFLAAARFVQAVGACAGPVLGRAVVRDIYGREGAARALAYIGAAMGLIPALAPIAGSYILVFFGWRAIFIFLAGFGVLALVGTFAVLRETNRWKDPSALDPRRMAANYRTMLADRAFLGYSLTVAFCYSALFMFLSGSGYVLISILGIPAEHFGFYFTAMASSYIVTTLIVGRVTLRLGIDRMIAGGTAIGAVAGILMAALAWAGVAHVLAVILPMCLHMVAMGIILPNAMAGAIGPHESKAGAASALLGFFQLAVAGVAGVLIGHWFGWTPVTLASAVMVLELGAFLIFRALVRRPAACAATP